MILVTGNQSGDLDNLVNSYVKFKILKHQLGDSEQIKILFNFPKNDFKLHREAIYLFKINDVDLNHIIFSGELNSLNLKELHINGNLQLILTDHNYPEDNLLSYMDCLCEVIDHHKVMKPINENVQTTIVNTGSCSSLIAVQFIDSIHSVKYKYTKEEIEKISRMLYYTIQMDIRHLSDNPNYNLDLDNRMLKTLSTYFKTDKKFIENLEKEKMNFGNFTAIDFLKKDYKSWTINNIPYGISSINQDIRQFYNSKDNYLNQIKSFISSQNLEILFMMHFIKKPILKRELTVTFSEDCRFKSEILKAIDNSHLFKSINFNDDLETSVDFFEQLNTDYSRKKIQPAIEQIIKEAKEN